MPRSGRDRLLFVPCATIATACVFTAILLAAAGGIDGGAGWRWLLFDAPNVDWSLRFGGRGRAGAMSKPDVTTTAFALDRPAGLPCFAAPPAP
jgi:hypothetical protein